jgi:hypothetical protein
MPSWGWILIVIVIVVVVALIAMSMMRRRRTTMLRDRFGPEYDRTVQQSEGQRAAEADLLERQKERDRLEIRPLAEPTRARFTYEWNELQERFVDQPSNAVLAADGLVYRVMTARGYPMDNFDAQAKLISVDHPGVVENYRFAHAVYERAHAGSANTEELREAFLHYRSLFDDLLETDDVATQAPSDGRVRTTPVVGTSGDQQFRTGPNDESTQRGIQ